MSAQQVEDLKQAIKEAFAGVILGNGIGLFEAQGIDDYASVHACSVLRAKDEKLNWENIHIDDLNQCYSSLCFFDADGMRFHLPAFLIADLNAEFCLSMVFSLTETALIESQFQSLNLQQRDVVRAYLEFIYNHEDYQLDRNSIHHALHGYWSH